MRILGIALTLGVAVSPVLLAGCGGGGSSSPTVPPCQNGGPYMQILYPVEKSKGVSPNVGTLVIAGTAIAPVRIAELGGPWRKAKQVSLPDPLPTPISTPPPNMSKEFAVSVGTLKSATTYDAYVWQSEDTCLIEPSPPGWTVIGEFTTE